MIDVVVVGGGPAGLLSAARLAHAGLDVVVLEEHSRVGDPTHCTGIVSAEVAEFVKLPDTIVLSRLSRAVLTGPGGTAANVVWDADAEEILVVDRAALDVQLADDAAAAGVTLRTGARAHSVDVDPDGVTVGARGEVVSARVCVLACGVSYAFQRRLGLGLPGQLIHTAQVEVDARPSDVVGVHFGREVAPDGFVWTVPVSRGGRSRLKIGVMARGDAGAHLMAFLTRPAVRDTLTAPPGQPIRRLLPLRPLPVTYAARVLAVGDAGGFTKPTTGGGIFYSLLTASLAADTIVRAFAAGRFDEETMGAYERRWQARLASELRVADWLRQLATRITDRDIDRLVRAVAADEVQAVIRRTARFNWHRDVILAAVRRPGIASVLLRSLFR